jgi:hypothetical protein
MQELKRQLEETKKQLEETRKELDALKKGSQTDPSAVPTEAPKVTLQSFS